MPGGVGDDWSGVTVCMHVRDLSCTTASMVAELPADPGQPVRVWSALGTPCTGVYLPVGVLGTSAVVPAVLGDPGAWRSFSRLSRAVEAPGDDGRAALAEVRAVLAPVEAEAWAEGDELWSSGATTGRWRTATSAWDDRVRAALGQLGVA